MHYWADLQSVHGFCCYDNTHLCKLIALYTANAYSAECKMSASACTHSIAGYIYYILPESQTTRNVLWSRASVCLSAAACVNYCTDPDVTWGSGRGCPLDVHYWADLQSVHGLRRYGNTMEMHGRAQW